MSDLSFDKLVDGRLIYYGVSGWVSAGVSGCMRDLLIDLLNN